MRKLGRKRKLGKKSKRSRVKFIRGRWVYDPETFMVLIPVEQYLRRVKQAKGMAKFRSDFPCPQVMRDIEPFRNVAVDGKEISSRSQKREMIKRNNLIEIGTEFKKTSRGGSKKKVSVKESLKRSMQQLGIT